ncbi:MAG: hypothetical protein ACYDCC_15845 [Actinomycetota bacterium]
MLLALTLINGPAHAGTTALKAPFDCGSDELARRTGAIVGFARVPKLPTQTHGCLSVDPSAPSVWSFYTAPSDGVILVTSSSVTGTVCVFVDDPGACTPQRYISVTAGATYAIGASLTDQTQAVLQEIDVAFST